MRLSIAQKLYSGFGLLIFLLAALAVYDYSVLNRVTAKYNTILGRETEAMTLLNGLENLMNVAQIAENHFAVALEEQYLKEHMETTNAMASHVERLVAIWTSAGYMDAEAGRTKLMGVIGVYADSFKTLSANLTVMGRDDKGLVGEFRKSVHQLEEMLGEAKALEVERDMLMLRRHEKDYLMRKDKKYIAKVEGQVETLKASSARILPPEMAAKARTLMDDYIAKFRLVVNAGDEVAQAQLRLDGYEQRMKSEVAAKLAEEKERMSRAISDAQESASSAKTFMAAISICGAAIGLALALFIGRGVTGPVSRAIPALERIAKGDFTHTVNVESSDEIGRLSEAINAMVANLRKTVSGAGRHALDLAAGSKKLSEVAGDLAAGAERMSTQSGSVAAASEQISTSISSMAAAVEQMSQNISAISGGAERMSSNMTSVSAAVEQMSATIGKISKGSTEAGTVASKASTMSAKAAGVMNSLGEAAKKIGEVTEVIKRIAEQTNLLALNATIEAASAGAAGKGFAVVANEIKELAHQSAAAAGDIAARIDGVQRNAREAVMAMNDVSNVIGAIDGAVAAIGVSVKEQTRAAESVSANVGESAREAQSIAKSISELAGGANSMSRAAGEAAMGVEGISKNIASVSQVAGSQSSGARQVSQSSGQINQIAGELETSMKAFLVG